MISSKTKLSPKNTGPIISNSTASQRLNYGNASYIKEDHRPTLEALQVKQMGLTGETFAASSITYGDTVTTSKKHTNRSGLPKPSKPSVEQHTAVHQRQANLYSTLRPNKEPRQQISTQTNNAALFGMNKTWQSGFNPSRIERNIVPMTNHQRSSQINQSQIDSNNPDSSTKDPLNDTIPGKQMSPTHLKHLSKSIYFKKGQSTEAAPSTTYERQRKAGESVSPPRGSEEIYVGGKKVQYTNKPVMAERTTPRSYINHRDYSQSRNRHQIHINEDLLISNKNGDFSFDNQNENSLNNAMTPGQEDTREDEIMAPKSTSNQLPQIRIRKKSNDSIINAMPGVHDSIEAQETVKVDIGDYGPTTPINFPPDKDNAGSGARQPLRNSVFSNYVHSQFSTEHPPKAKKTSKATQAMDRSTSIRRREDGTHEGSRSRSPKHQTTSSATPTNSKFSPTRSKKEREKRMADNIERSIKLRKGEIIEKQAFKGQSKDLDLANKFKILKLQHLNLGATQAAQIQDVLNDFNLAEGINASRDGSPWNNESQTSSPQTRQSVIKVSMIQKSQNEKRSGEASAVSKASKKSRTVSSDSDYQDGEHKEKEELTKKLSKLSSPAIRQRLSNLLETSHKLQQMKNELSKLEQIVQRKKSMERFQSNDSQTQQAPKIPFPKHVVLHGPVESQQPQTTEETRIISHMSSTASKVTAPFGSHRVSASGLRSHGSEVFDSELTYINKLNMIRRNENLKLFSTLLGNSSQMNLIDQAKERQRIHNFRIKRRTLGALLTDRKPSQTMTIQEEEGNESKSVSQSKKKLDQELRFDQNYWKIQTSKIVDNNMMGIGSILKTPTMGTFNIQDQSSFFKKRSRSIQRPAAIDNFRSPFRGKQGKTLKKNLFKNMQSEAETQVDADQYSKYPSDIASPSPKTNHPGNLTHRDTEQAFIDKQFEFTNEPSNQFITEEDKMKSNKDPFGNSNKNRQESDGAFFQSMNNLQSGHPQASVAASTITSVGVQEEMNIAIEEKHQQELQDKVANLSEVGTAREVKISQFKKKAIKSDMVNTLKLPVSSQHSLTNKKFMIQPDGMSLDANRHPTVLPEIAIGNNDVNITTSEQSRLQVENSQPQSTFQDFNMSKERALENSEYNDNSSALIDQTEQPSQYDGVPPPSVKIGPMYSRKSQNVVSSLPMVSKDDDSFKANQNPVEIQEEELQEGDSSLTLKQQRTNPSKPSKRAQKQVTMDNLFHLQQVQSSGGPSISVSNKLITQGGEFSRAGDPILHSKPSKSPQRDFRDVGIDGIPTGDKVTLAGGSNLDDEQADDDLANSSKQVSGQLDPTKSPYFVQSSAEQQLMNQLEVQVVKKQLLHPDMLETNSTKSPYQSPDRPRDLHMDQPGSDQRIIINEGEAQFKGKEEEGQKVYKTLAEYLPKSSLNDSALDSKMQILADKANIIKEQNEAVMQDITRNVNLNSGLSHLQQQQQNNNNSSFQFHFGMSKDNSVANNLNAQSSELRQRPGGHLHGSEPRRKLKNQGSPRTLRGSQLNDQGRTAPLRGGGGSLPHGPQPQGQFGSMKGVHSPTKILKAKKNLRPPQQQSSQYALPQSHLQSFKERSSGDIQQARTPFDAELFMKDRSELSRTLMLSPFQQQSDNNSCHFKTTDLTGLGPFQIGTKTADVRRHISPDSALGENYTSSFQVRDLGKNSEPKFLNVQLTQMKHEQRMKNRIGKSGRLFYQMYEANLKHHSTPFVSKPQIKMWQDANDSFYERMNVDPEFLTKAQASQRKKDRKLVEITKEKKPLAQTYKTKADLEQDDQPLIESVQQDQRSDFIRMDTRPGVGCSPSPPILVDPKTRGNNRAIKIKDEDRSYKKRSTRMSQIIKFIDPKVEAERARCEKQLHRLKEIFDSRMQRGKSQLQVIQDPDSYDNMTDFEIKQLIGELSWLWNPENELHLYDLMLKDQLFEVLQYGMSKKERQTMIMDNVKKRKVSLQSPSNSSRKGVPPNMSAGGGSSQNSLQQSSVDYSPNKSTQMPPNLSIGEPSMQGSPTSHKQHGVSTLQTQRTSVTLQNQQTTSGKSASNLTHQQIYDQNPLTALDLSRFSPSLLLKLFSEPNKILKTERHRKDYVKRVEAMIEETKQRYKPSKEQHEVVQLVDEILNMSQQDWQILRLNKSQEQIEPEEEEPEEEKEEAGIQPDGTIVGLHKKKKRFIFPEGMPDSEKEKYLEREREKPSENGMMNIYKIDWLLKEFEKELKKPRKTTLRQLRLEFSGLVAKRLAEEANGSQRSHLTHYSSQRNLKGDSSSEI